MKHNGIVIEILVNELPSVNPNLTGKLFPVEKIYRHRFIEDEYKLTLYLINRDFSNVDGLWVKSNIYKQIKYNLVHNLYKFHLNVYLKHKEKIGNSILYPEYFLWVINKSIDEVIKKLNMVEIKFKWDNFYAGLGVERVDSLLNDDKFLVTDGNNSFTYDNLQTYDENVYYDSSEIKKYMIKKLKFNEDDWYEFEKQIFQILDYIKTDKFIENISMESIKYL